MKILIDGVFFQFAQSGIARVWSSIIPLLIDRKISVYILNRGNLPNFQGAEIIDFPSYKFSYCAEDSILIQKMCNFLNVDLFTTTYYTTPLSTPMFLMIYDLIPELFDFNMNDRGWLEKKTAIAYAQNYLCISNNTKKDLINIYNKPTDKNTHVAYCGINHSIFKKNSIQNVSMFYKKYNINKRYFILVGSREQHKGYKNTKIFFESLSKVSDKNYEILCVGGESVIDPYSLSVIPHEIVVHHLSLTDEELSLAYSGAIALVYPSLYEGFGMPVIEAMACGCPVITTNLGSLAEAASNAAILISGTDHDQLVSALNGVLNSHERDKTISRGLMHAGEFTWDVMADIIVNISEEIICNNKSNIYSEHFKKWEELRKMQALVDIC